MLSLLQRTSVGRSSSSRRLAAGNDHDVQLLRTVSSPFWWLPVVVCLHLMAELWQERTDTVMLSLTAPAADGKSVPWRQDDSCVSNPVTLAGCPWGRRGSLWGCIPLGVGRSVSRTGDSCLQVATTVSSHGDPASQPPTAAHASFTLTHADGLGRAGGGDAEYCWLIYRLQQASST